MQTLIEDIIAANVSRETWSWLQEMKGADVVNNTNWFNRTFSRVPSKTGKSVVTVTSGQNDRIQQRRAGFSISGWPVDRLCRVWLLLNLDTADQDAYFTRIENLFVAPELEELVALYSALPVLAFPEIWKERCAEGIRSNISFVLEAIMYDNPYASDYLEQPAWNQMILKAFFTDKEVHKITGLDRRANRDLAVILSDYARERWAAGRTVPRMLWRMVGPFIDEDLFRGIKRAYSGDAIERKAAAIAIGMSDYKPAKDMLNEVPELKHAVENNLLNWADIAMDQPVK